MIPTLTEYDLQPFVHVMAFGGLSESGKSSAAEFLRREHGYTRLKIGYLLELAGTRYNLRPYDELSEQDQARAIVEELALFAKGHRDQRLFTIESLHRFEQAKTLRKILGDKLQVVFLHAPKRLRAAREQVNLTQLTDKDAIKLARGAARILDIADNVIDNSGSLLQLNRTLSTILPPAQLITTTDPGDVTRLPAPLAEWLPNFAKQSAGTDEWLILTGSPSWDEWIPGWSDVDLLHISATPDIPKLRGSLRHFVGLIEGTSVGLTSVSKQEVATGHVTPRVVHTLRLLATGGAFVLASGCPLVAPSQKADIRASVTDLIAVTSTMRRLLIEGAEDSLRAVWKHALLYLKLRLRLDGTWVESSRSVLAAAAAHGLMPVDLPSLEVVSHAHLAGTDSDSYRTLLDHVLHAAGKLLGDG